MSRKQEKHKPGKPRKAAHTAKGPAVTAPTELQPFVEKPAESTTGTAEAGEVLRVVIEEFFVNYHRLQGKKFKLLARNGEKTALHLIEKSQKAFSEK